MAKNPWILLAWPAFMTACVLEMLVFAVVDPHDLSWAGAPLDWSREAIYSLAFFVFWTVAWAQAWLLMLLCVSTPSKEVPQP